MVLPYGSASISPTEFADLKKSKFLNPPKSRLDCTGRGDGFSASLLIFVPKSINGSKPR